MKVHRNVKINVIVADELVFEAGTLKRKTLEKKKRNFPVIWF